MNLSGLLIGYRPVIDRDRRIMALEVGMAPRDGQVLLMSALYGLIADGTPLRASTLILSSPTAEFDSGLLEIEPTPGLWLAVPAAVAEMPLVQPWLMRLHEKGMGMVLQGLPTTTLPETLLSIFRLAMVEQAEERRAPPSDDSLSGGPVTRVRRSVATVVTGVSTVAEMAHAFASGAYAVCGWLMPDVQGSDDAVSSTDFLGVLRLIDMVDQDADMRDIEAEVRKEPELAFRMLSHLESVSFGMSVPVQNFQHAVMVLGYRGLKRWLTLMLVSVNPDPDRRPLMLASFRRGLIMERIMGREADSTMREEMFVLGVFSLLDRALGQPFETLLSRVSVSEQVAEALIARRGPYAPMLAIVEGIEQMSAETLMPALAQCHLGLEDCNRALLQTLRVAAL